MNLWTEVCKHERLQILTCKQKDDEYRPTYTGYDTDHHVTPICGCCPRWSAANRMQILAAAYDLFKNILRLSEWLRRNHSCQKGYIWHTDNWNCTMHGARRSMPAAVQQKQSTKDTPLLQRRSWFQNHYIHVQDKTLTGMYMLPHRRMME